MNLTQVQKTIEAIETLSGCRLCIHDYTNRINPVLGRKYSIHSNPYCSAVKRPDDYKTMRCVVDDTESVQSRLEKTMKPFFKICHMNVWEAVSPILLGTEVCGGLFLGPFRAEELKEDNEKAKRTERLSRTTAAELEEFSKLPIMSREGAEHILTLADTVTLCVSLLIAQEPGRPREGRSRSELIDRFIQDRMGHSIGLNDLAAFLSLSPSRTSRITKELKSCSFSELLRKARIARAKRYLTLTSFTNTQIAWNCGFRGQAYFQRVFKQSEGITPGEYRKKHYRERVP